MSNWKVKESNLIFLGEINLFIFVVLRLFYNVFE